MKNVENFLRLGQGASCKGKKKNVIAFSWSESLNSHKKINLAFFAFFFALFPQKRAIFSIFFKKVLLPKWSPYIALTSYQKSDKFLKPFLSNKSKTIFTPFYPFFAQKSTKAIFFFKNRFPSLFYIYGPLTSCQKSEKFLEPIPRTLRHRLNGQTNWRTRVNV